ncbi:trypsin-like peptidase domain-containing protein [Fulvivirgaceae bacterium BMA10]|uniref:Trypsin-like peptidase domain-containing protein n=1 Tax=Splendidivirga corallicola TaxID=3051826 RepID=A0ABT8KK56_9BACT|nr:trypsin-like peptidase domain-containing protein [Fulvivirgaceae bacterium BMA10]
MKNIVTVIIVGFLAGLGGAFTFSILNEQSNSSNTEKYYATNDTSNHNYVNYTSESRNKEIDNPSDRIAPNKIDANENFVLASRNSTNSVVFIKTVSGPEYGSGGWLDWFFEGRGTQRVGSGSGVIYSKDGYIVTNNHVIDNAEVIEVIHNKVPYEASVIGTDPSTDLAVLKIEAKDLPNIAIGSSKKLAVGEWVLAVGNPFNLTSTVTAGIVSAKGREINILRSKFPIESFIQTDAAINPGNSGGALVNAAGELVGINTAILSRTGSYAGYGFAVPVDIVKKVVDDLIQYGEVQKAFFGAEVIDLSPEIAETIGADNLSGVVLSYIQRGGSAEEMDFEKGDIILKIDGEDINTKSEFEEMLSYYSPGDKITIVYKRNNKINTRSITLRNREGTTGIIKKELYSSKKLGVDFETVPKIERDQLGIDHGVRVAKIKDGFFRRLDIQEGFIITSINRKAIKNPQQLANILEEIRGKVRIDGINKRGVRGYYSYYF